MLHPLRTILKFPRQSLAVTVVSLLSAGCVVALDAAAALGADDGLRTLEIKQVKQLFIDDFIIDEMRDVKRTVCQPQRHASNPIVRPEHPWEGTHTVSPTVIHLPEEKAFRMYYWAYGEDGNIYTCYATSTDGLHWQKPIIGRHEGPDGTKRNNIVLRGEGRQARTRYVAINPYAATTDEKFVAMYIDNVPGLTEFVAISPDGILWKTVAKIGDLRNVTGSPPTPNPRFFLVEQKWLHGDLDHRYRAIWRTESHDLRAWSGGVWAIRREPDDDPNTEFYHATSHFMGSHTYHGLHLGYYYPYHTDPAGVKNPDGVRMAGTIETALMVSRDTIHWTRVGRTKPFLSLGEQGSWDAGMVFAQPENVVNDEIWFYYSGHAKEHSAKQNTGAIGLATLRLDGFVAIEPEGAKGALTTKPFVLAGDGISVNADASRGHLRVAALDTHGKPIDGFSGDDCHPITKDALRHVVKWTGGGKIASLRGQSVRLRFELTGDVKLYAFQVISDQK